MELHIVVFVTMLGIVAGLALLARWSRLPETVLFVLAGLVLSEWGWGLPFSLDPNTILYLFLPPLLFAASFRLDLSLLRRTLSPILILAIPGVLLSAGVAGLVAHVVAHLPWTSALLFGGIMAATDPVAVLALFRRLGVPLRLAMIVEGESLLNDGTALILFGALLALTLGHVDAATEASSLVMNLMGGMAIGCVLGFLASHITALVDDHLVEMLLSTALAYGSFVGAMTLNASGVLATVCAGLVLGSYGRRIGMSPTTIRLLDDLWDYLAFFANAVLFLLIGVTVPGHTLVGAPQLVLVATGATVLARGAVIYLLGPLAMRGRHRLALAERHVLFWGGLHGAIGVAAALSLPPHLPHRTEIQIMAYGAIIVTLLLQGLSLAPLLRLLFPGLRQGAAPATSSPMPGG